MSSLKTERLVLRPTDRTDANDIARLINNFNVSRRLDRVPYSYARADALDFVRRMAQGRTAGTDYVFAITVSGAFIGCIGLHWVPSARTADPSHTSDRPLMGSNVIASRRVGRVGEQSTECDDVTKRGAWELGYWLGEPSWGQGYMSEAARAVCQSGFADLWFDRIVAGCHAANPASRRVLEKLGFRYIRDDRRYSVARAEWVVSYEFALEAKEFTKDRLLRRVP